MDIKKVSVRAASGLVYIAIVTGLICCGYSGVLLLTAIFTVLATLEFDRISAAPGRKSLTVLVCDVLLNLCIALAAGPQVFLLAPSAVLLLFVRYVLELHAGEEHPLNSLSSSIMSIVYIAMPMFCMTALGGLLADSSQLLAPRPVWLLLFIFVLIWINDTFAFLVGSFLGRHKMSPTISPKKTWEGLIGGAAFTCEASIIAGTCIFTSVPWSWWLWGIFGILVSLFATWGDLTESLIKRNLGLKDSGNLMPGHGGILDRIDSLLFVMPLTFLFTYIIRLSPVYATPSFW